MISKRTNAIFLFAVAAIASVQAAEIHPTATVSEQNIAQTSESVVWYKNRSTHIIAAFAATAMGIYALAVRNNKVAGPVALFTALLYGRKNAQDIKNASEVKDADNKNPHGENKIASEHVNPVSPQIVTQEEDPKKITSDTTITDILATNNIIEKNTLPTSEAPLHIQAKQYAQHALDNVKGWLAAGLIDENHSQN